jgi:hypothetical protein
VGLSLTCRDAARERHYSALERLLDLAVASPISQLDYYSHVAELPGMWLGSHTGTLSEHVPTAGWQLCRGASGEGCNVNRADTFPSPALETQFPGLARLPALLLQLREWRFIRRVTDGGHCVECGVSAPERLDLCGPNDAGRGVRAHEHQSQSAMSREPPCAFGLLVWPAWSLSSQNSSESLLSGDF